MVSSNNNNNVPATASAASAAHLLRGAAGRFAGDINVPVYATVKGVSEYTVKGGE